MTNEWRSSNIDSERAADHEEIAVLTKGAKEGKYRRRANVRTQPISNRKKRLPVTSRTQWFSTFLYGPDELCLAVGDHSVRF